MPGPECQLKEIEIDAVADPHATTMGEANRVLRGLPVSPSVLGGLCRPRHRAWMTALQLQLLLISSDAQLCQQQAPKCAT